MNYGVRLDDSPRTPRQPVLPPRRLVRRPTRFGANGADRAAPAGTWPRTPPDRIVGRAREQAAHLAGRARVARVGCAREGRLVCFVAAEVVAFAAAVHWL